MEIACHGIWHSWLSSGDAVQDTDRARTTWNSICERISSPQNVLKLLKPTVCFLACSRQEVMVLLKSSEMNAPVSAKMVHTWKNDKFMLQQPLFSLTLREALNASGAISIELFGQVVMGSYMGYHVDFNGEEGCKLFPKSFCCLPPEDKVSLMYPFQRWLL